VKLDVTALPPGTVLLGKYRVIGNIGLGGMGVVVAAEHLSLHTKVAVKFMLPQLVQHESVVKRFVNEARAAGRIQSAHVARVLDVGSMTGEGLPEDGVPYMVMEFLQGKDLSLHVRAGKRFPVTDAVDYVIQASEALAEAHKEGIIHRDIKPANLFLAEFEGRKVVKVLDFGISKILDEEPQEMNLTKTTTVLGSGLYMSPEQMRSAKNVDFRTDVYSLGVCLFELLAGTQPFTAETFSELVVKVNIDPPTPLKQYRPDISDEFAAVLAKAYARKPEDRYQSIQEMVAALAPFADAGSSAAIRSVQGITLAEGRLSGLPANAGHPLAGTAGAMTASSGAEVAATTGKSRALLVAGGLGVVAGVAAIVFMLQKAPPASNATTLPPASAIVTAEPVATESPVATAAASAEPTAEPVLTASASASAAPDAVPATSGRPLTAGPGPRRPAGTSPPPPPPPPPPKCVTKRDPTTGLIVPCL
jgi:tRNA A-37 threonylcarbamoyl transferase component Bud32